MDNQENVVHSPGLLGGITALAKNVVGLLVSRAELAALEMAEVRNHLIELVAIFAVAVMATWFALAYGTASGEKYEGPPNMSTMHTLLIN